MHYVLQGFTCGFFSYALEQFLIKKDFQARMYFSAQLAFQIGTQPPAITHQLYNSCYFV